MGNSKEMVCHVGMAFDVSMHADELNSRQSWNEHKHTVRSHDYDDIRHDAVHVRLQHSIGAMGKSCEAIGTSNDGMGDTSKC